MTEQTNTAEENDLDPLPDAVTRKLIDKKTDLADALASRGYLDAAKIIRDERDELQAELAQVNDPSTADNDK